MTASKKGQPPNLANDVPFPSTSRAADVVLDRVVYELEKVEASLAAITKVVPNPAAPCPGGCGATKYESFQNNRRLAAVVGMLTTTRNLLQQVECGEWKPHVAPAKRAESETDHGDER